MSSENEEVCPFLVVVGKPNQRAPGIRERVWRYYIDNKKKYNKIGCNKGSKGAWREYSSSLTTFAEWGWNPIVKYDGGIYPKLCCDFYVGFCEVSSDNDETEATEFLFLLKGSLYKMTYVDFFEILQIPYNGPEVWTDNKNDYQRMATKFGFSLEDFYNTLLRPEAPRPIIATEMILSVNLIDDDHFLAHVVHHNIIPRGGNSFHEEQVGLDN